jgi:hypothetical protein
MKSGGPLKHFVLAFFFALVCYAIFYPAIENRRTRKGPWLVRFTRATTGDPALVIDQPLLAITNLQLVFVGETLPASNSARMVTFEQPKQTPYEVPFGQCIFMDTTFLPGTVTFRLFGHEIELIPRVLMIDHQEHPWLSDAVITLHPEQESTAKPVSSSPP